MTGDGVSGSPVGRGGAGTYIEGELGAYYMLSMLAGAEARGAPGSAIERVQFQAVDDGFSLDDVVVHGRGPQGATVLEIQSKRTIAFSPKDPIFAEVCAQLADSVRSSPPAPERHLLAVATQRTSFKISGPYQDVLEWARAVSSADAFFGRLGKGKAGSDMREFVAAFRAHLIGAGVEDDDQVIWSILRRFKIIEFDFEAGASQASAYAKLLARQILAPADRERHEALWSVLIEIAIASGKVGGSIAKDELRRRLATKGFHLEGARDFVLARAKLDELTRHAVADIGQTVAGIHLPRQALIAEFDEAHDQARFIELRGNPGSGKSSVMRTLIQRTLADSRALVLDPVGTPAGGWAALALRLGVETTAREFLSDLAVSGGATMFVDALEMFTDPEKQRTVNDLLGEVAAIEGFAVVATARLDFGANGEDWLSPAAMKGLGPGRRVEVRDLDDEDVGVLREQAGQLRALLAPDHPAAPIARNLYRLTRLLKVRDAASISTEAALASNWWQTADGAPPAQIRAAQRIIARLVDATVSGEDGLTLEEDSTARNALVASLTLRETRRDRLGFYHDILRDWAIGLRIDEEPDLLQRMNLAVPVPPTLARGIEIAGRLALERSLDISPWVTLLDRLSVGGAHGSWRRQALLAVVRSELAPELLDRASESLLSSGGRLLGQLCAAILAVETIRLSDLTGGAAESAEVSGSFWITVTPSAKHVLRWCADHADELPVSVMEDVVRLGTAYLPLYLNGSPLASSFAGAMFRWLVRLDLRDDYPSRSRDDDLEAMPDGARRRLVEDLRSLCLLLAPHAVDETKSYLRAIATERKQHKLKRILSFGQALARVAPEELAAMVETALIPPTPVGRGRKDSSRDKAFDWVDSDFLPPSPAQPPFLDLLKSAPEVGLRLIRRLVDHAILHTDDSDGIDEAYTLIIDGRERVFPRSDSYFWSRGQSHDYAVVSGLLALEAWGHARLDAEEDVDSVLRDVLGPVGSPAAFVLTAVDLVLSHWPQTKEAVVPFVTSAELLAVDRTRVHLGEMGAGTIIGDEPKGPVRLADLQKRVSRRARLEDVIPHFVGDPASGEIVERLRAASARLGAYTENATFADPAFMVSYALNLMDPANWTAVENGRAYNAPETEAKHLERLHRLHHPHFRDTEVSAFVSLAVGERSRATPELVRQAAEHAARAMPDPEDTDFLKSRATTLVSTAMLVVRDGDDALLAAYQDWVRQIVDWALEEKGDRFPSMRGDLRYNRPALAITTLIHLWRRLGHQADVARLIEQAARKDRGGAPAFSHAAHEVASLDPRVAKSSLRVAFSSCRYLWKSYDADETEVTGYEQSAKRRIDDAIAGELVWLHGGAEPPWPDFPNEVPTVQRGFRIGSATVIDEDPMPRPSVVENVDTQGAALWLRAITDSGATADWKYQVAEHYAEWTAIANGASLSRGEVPELRHREWNLAFYSLTVRAMLDGSEEVFDRLLTLVERLPDRAFTEIATTLLQDGDAWYFNSSEHEAERPLLMRERIGRRLMETRLWQRRRRPGELSVDNDAGPIVAAFFMSVHNPFSTTRTYLVPAVFERIDPLLTSLLPLLRGGPISLVALCTMSTLSLVVRSRHTDFVLSAAEAWIELAADDMAIWIDLRIGRSVAVWLETAANEDSAVLGGDHPLRSRLDRVVGFLVGLGIAEAHQLELRIARNR